MKIDIISSVDYIKKEKVQDKTVVVIDMLRATSVIITALANGCHEVIPVIDVEEAKDIVNENREKYILGGERKALKIEGFDFSNSPLDYTKEVSFGKTLVITTTNGTKALNGALGGKDILVGALINAKAVAKKTIELNNDLVIINAGTYGEFSMDDFICGGYIIHCILKECNAELSDIAVAALNIYENNSDIASLLCKTKHYSHLVDLGFLDDIEYCCRKDILYNVPRCFYTGSRLVIR